MDLRALLSDADDRLVCSAKGCRATATWAIRWNNPTVHHENRRKVWLACDEHEPTLRQFLSARGFYRDTVGPGDLEPTDG